MAVDPARGFRLLKKEESEIVMQINQLVSELEIIKKAVKATEKGKQFETGSWAIMLREFKKSTKNLSLHLQIFIGELIPARKS